MWYCNKFYLVGDLAGDLLGNLVAKIYTIVAKNYIIVAKHNFIGDMARGLIDKSFIL
jgi:hypothetical protein